MRAVFASGAEVISAGLHLPDPFAYVIQEGGRYLAWDNPVEAYATFFESGIVIDRLVGVCFEPDQVPRIKSLVEPTVNHDPGVS